MGNYTILVLDDDQGARTLLEIMLTRHGFSVRLANDADEALEKIEAEMPHLVISDVSLPGMNGIEFVRELRQHEVTARLPVVILSAHHDNTTIEAAMAAGATQFMKKPLKMDGLRDTLTGLIENND